MWRFTRNNGYPKASITMETINRVAYGFRNFETMRLRVRCYGLGVDSGNAPAFWR